MKRDINFRKRKTIDDLEQDLYNPNFIPEHRTRRKIHDRDIELDKEFNTQEYENALNARSKFELPTSLFKKIFLVALGVFVTSSLIVAAFLYEGRSESTSDLIAFDILGSTLIGSGDNLELRVRVQNFNKQPLELPDVLLSYSTGTGTKTERRSLPDIEFEQLYEQNFTIQLFGQVGEVRNVEAILEYRLPGSSSIFIKEVEHEVLINSTPTEMIVKAPEFIVRNQELILLVDVFSNTLNRVSNTLLKVDYPREGFEFLGASHEPSFANNTWHFPSLGQEPQTIEIRGRLPALEGQSRSFRFQFGRENPLNKNQIETVLNSHTHVVSVEPSFIDTSLQVNNISDEKSTLRGGGTMNVVLRYTNSTEQALENVIITLNLEGELYDASRINLQNGFYNSSRKAIVFDQTSSERLRLVQPGQGGEFRFTLYGRDLVSAQEVLKNPQVVLSADVEATRPNGQHEQAFAVARHIVQANSDIAVHAEAQYKEGPFQNSGPLPPRVNFPTNYTIVLGVTNSSNTIEDSELSTYLPQGVEWMNIISPSTERNNVNYDSLTRKLTWKLGEVSAGTGVGTSTPRQLMFQITLTPSAAHIGNPVNLTNDIVLTGKDTFSGTELSYRKTPLQNQLKDRSLVGYDGRVVQ